MDTDKCKVHVIPCLRLLLQTWHEMENFSLQLGGALCLDFEDANVGKSFPRLMKCHYMGGSQEWKWTSKVRVEEGGGGVRWGGMGWVWGWGEMGGVGLEQGWGWGGVSRDGVG